MLVCHVPASCIYVLVRIQMYHCMCDFLSGELHEDLLGESATAVMMRATRNYIGSWQAAHLRQNVLIDGSLSKCYV